MIFLMEAGMEIGDTGHWNYPFPAGKDDTYTSNTTSIKEVNVYCSKCGKKIRKQEASKRSYYATTTEVCKRCFTLSLFDD